MTTDTSCTSCFTSVIILNLLIHYYYFACFKNQILRLRVFVTFLTADWYNFKHGIDGGCVHDGIVDQSATIVGEVIPPSVLVHALGACLVQSLLSQCHDRPKPHPQGLAHRLGLGLGVEYCCFERLLSRQIIILIMKLDESH